MKTIHKVILKRISLSLVALLVFHTPTAVADPSIQPNTKIVRATVTAYSSTLDQTDSTPEVMASGKKVYAGAVACPRKYLFGTKLKINGQEYTCEDRMHLRFNDRFDIWFATRADAKKFGVRNLPIEVLTPTELAVNM